MAEEKKPEGWNLDPVETVIVVIIGASLVSTIVPAIWNYIVSGEISFFGFKFTRIFTFIAENSFFFRILGFVIAGLAAWWTYKLNRGGDAIWREEKAKLYPIGTPEPSFDNEPAKNPLKEKWEKILEKSESDNPSDWRLAIIEADIILADLLDKMGLPGETMGEKMKAVEKSDFTTIEQAWEAHKARNFIAHEGSDFLLSQRETRRIISLYQAVFKEFYLI